MNAVDATVAQAYRDTDYRVRLPDGGHASIRIGTPLPQPLLDRLPVPGATWGFITAWNPRSRSLQPAANRERQERLREALHHLAPHAQVLEGVGVGPGDGDEPAWREESLYVAGVPQDVLDELMRRFEQHAIVCAAGDAAAELRWNT